MTIILVVVATALIAYWFGARSESTINKELHRQLTEERTARRIAERGLRRVEVAGNPVLEAQLALEEISKSIHKEEK